MLKLVNIMSQCSNKKKITIKLKRHKSLVTRPKEKERGVPYLCDLPSFESNFDISLDDL
jgi:hypothetical protein